MVSNMYIYIWLYIAIYSHIYSVYTPKWCAKMTSQHNYSQEADVRYTKHNQAMV